MKNNLKILVTALALLSFSCADIHQHSGNDVRLIASADQEASADKDEFWLTQGDGSILLQQQNWTTQTLSLNEESSELLTHIKIMPEEKFQTVDGFGYALTGGSADLISWV